MILIGGEPGIGKSTLLLQVAARLQARGHATLYASGEESALQIKLRADRLGEDAGDVTLLSETNLETILTTAAAAAPAVLDRRLDPDRVHDRSRGRARQRRPGARVRRATDALRQGERHRGVRRRARHEGRRHRRPEDARAHRRHGALLRGRELARSSRAARDEESLRQRGRDRRVPHGARTASCPSPIRRSSSSAIARMHASGSAVTALLEGHAARSSSRCRGSRRRRASARRSAWPPATTGGASRCCSRCSTSAPASRSRSSTSFSTSSAACGCRSRRAISPSPPRSRRACTIASLPHDAVFIGEVGLGGEIRPVSQAERRLAEAANMGMTTAYLAERAVPKRVPKGLRADRRAHDRRSVRADLRSERARARATSA